MSHSELQLYSYQTAILGRLREGFIAGHQAQMLVAPTGAGKTEMAMELLEAAANMGNRAAMVLDRIVLCNQTSERLDKYGIGHGVLQSGHWRYRPHELIQVCSAQTLERRGSFPGLKLLIVDEAHQTRRQTVEFIKGNPHVKVVGLSATPFTQGLGKIYTNVVSAVSTKELVGLGRLAPLKIYIAKEIDMTGAAKVAGEWSSKEASDRGIKITGDVVSEWVKKTHEVFGGPRKTVVFAAGVAHAADLAAKFAEAGYNFLSLSYKDDDQYKADVIKDFSKPDTSIHGLIATDILTKGFDCIAEGSMVLTDKGLVAIDKLSLSDKIWDGVEFVSHGGAIFKGVRDVVTYAGLTATPDHKVKTAKGWVAFGTCAEQEIPIIQTGEGGAPIQECAGYFRQGSPRKEQDQFGNVHVQVHGMWDRVVDSVVRLATSALGWVPSLRPALMVNRALQVAASAMQGQVAQGFQGLRRPWYRVPLQFAEGGGNLGASQSWRATKQGDAAGQERQRRPLRSREPALVNSRVQQLSHEGQSPEPSIPSIQDGAPGDSIRRQDAAESDGVWVDGRTNHRTVQQAVGQTKRRVWDVLNAGPRNCFTCEGLLVHNCADVMIGVSARPFSKSLASHVQQMGRVMRSYPGKEFGLWLCHSGNVIRFADDWQDVYENGVTSIDEGKEKPRKEKTEREKEAAKCPRCSAFWPGQSDTCACCGYVRPVRSEIIVNPGEMEQFQGGGSREEKQQFYGELLGWARHKGYKPGWVANKYREKFGVWPRGLDEKPLSTSLKTSRWIQRSQIAWARSKAA